MIKLDNNICLKFKESGRRHDGEIRDEHVVQVKRESNSVDSSSSERFPR